MAMKDGKGGKQTVHHKDIANPHRPECFGEPESNHIVDLVYFGNHCFERPIVLVLPVTRYFLSLGTSCDGDPTARVPLSGLVRISLRFIVQALLHAHRCAMGNRRGELEIVRQSFDQG